MQAHAVQVKSHTTAGFRNVAEIFGYAYQAVEGSRDDDDILVKDRLGLAKLSAGLTLCASDLTAARDSAHEGQLPRSLSIAIMLDGVMASCDFGTRQRCRLSPGAAAMVAVADGARLAGRLLKGERSRCLLIHARPDEIEDEELSKWVADRLSSDAICPMALSCRSLALANELFEPGQSSAVGRLLAESCALELLARGLMTCDAERLAGCPLSRTDFVRMSRVRDRLMEEPEYEHSLSDLAREVGVSVTSLKEKFAAVYGKPVFAFLRDGRLESASAAMPTLFRIERASIGSCRASGRCAAVMLAVSCI